RAVVGWDSSRLAMLMAVLDTRCGLALGGGDVYLNVAGGLRITEPAADLAVVASLISSLSGVPLPPETIFFGEVGLSGEVRPVAHTDVRLKEATKLGFMNAVIPTQRAKNKQTLRDHGLNIQEVEHVAEIAARFGPKSENAVQELRVDSGKS
ncbi:MAG: DNA repair protein RadA, partial [Rhodospirillales bacterium]|nr:DNA repair protein RadA [Rhodospirillales bacterium]